MKNQKIMFNLRTALSKYYHYLMGILLIFLYLLFVSNYIKGNICNSRNTFGIFSLLYGIIAFIYCNYFRWRETVKNCYFFHHKSTLFFIIPLCAFYINEIIYNIYCHTITFSRVTINYVILLGIQIGIFLIIHNLKITYAVLLSASWVSGIANFYVLKFKGNPLIPSDLLSFRTGIAVASNYTFELSDSIIHGSLLYLLIMCIVLYSSYSINKYTFKQSAITIGSGFVHIFLVFWLTLQINWGSILNIKIDAWSPQNLYFQNGYLFSFLFEAQSMIATKPDNYSVKLAESTLNSYSTAETVAQERNMPSVIIIMNESFSDLSVVGSFESDPYLSNLNGMTSFVQKGHAYTSVLGGGTCNSEFEFLTGNSMANFTGNVYPYQMYNLENVPNLAFTFKEQGYHTIAIHPAAGNNWNREKVYQTFGFEDFISLEDMDDVENIGYYPSDSYNYQQVINAYEASEGPTFIFNVTMQNHGGYKGNLDGLSAINIETKYKQYSDVVMYLTLIRESDKAFADLLSYFSDVTEPVIICMFGDHQPVLDENFISSIQDKDEIGQNRFITPYIIWSNFDTGVSNITKDLSLNYLGVNILKLVGFSSPYFDYLLDLQEKITVINKKGYQLDDGNWYSLQQSNSMLDMYRILQHYTLFQKKN